MFENEPGMVIRILVYAVLVFAASFFGLMLAGHLWLS
jgi:hypothetical protein